MSYEIAVYPDGGVISAHNGSLSWIDDDLVETYTDEDEFRERLNEIHAEQ